MDYTNSEDKAWVTMSTNVNLGNYENLKIEVGYSQTLKEGDVPIKKVEAMQEELEYLLARKLSEFDNIKRKNHAVRKRKERD